MRTSKPTIFFAFAAIYLIWGSTYLALRIGIETIPPFLLSSMRFLVAGTMVLLWCLFRKEKLPNRGSLITNCVCGVLMLGGGTVSVAWSEQYLPSGTAAIVVTFLPFWFVMLDKRQWSYYFSNKIILVGLLLGFTGVMLLVGFNHTSTLGLNKPGHPALGVIVILCGNIAWTIGSLYAKYTTTNSGLLMNGSVQMLATSFACAIASFAAGEWNSFSLPQVSADSAIALVYLMFVGSIVAYPSYLYLLHVRPPAQVSTYVYVNPLIAVLLGAAIANEQITFLQVIALLIILCGVFLVNVPKYAALKFSKTS